MLFILAGAAMGSVACQPVSKRLLLHLYTSGGSCRSSAYMLVRAPLLPCCGKALRVAAILHIFGQEVRRCQISCCPHPYGGKCAKHITTSSALQAGFKRAEGCHINTLCALRYLYCCFSASMIARMGLRVHKCWSGALQC